MPKKTETRFIDGTDRINRMLAEPELAAEVAKVRSERWQKTATTR